MVLVQASTLVTGPLLVSNVPYDAVKDFTAISEIGTVPLIVTVHPRWKREVHRPAARRPEEIHLRHVADRLRRLLRHRGHQARSEAGWHAGRPVQGHLRRHRRPPRRPG